MHSSLREDRVTGLLGEENTEVVVDNALLRAENARLCADSEQHKLDRDAENRLLRGEETRLQAEIGRLGEDLIRSRDTVSERDLLISRLQTQIEELRRQPVLLPYFFLLVDLAVRYFFLVVDLAKSGLFSSPRVPFPVDPVPVPVPVPVAVHALPLAAAPAPSTLIVVDYGNSRLLYLDASSHQISRSMDLGKGEWCGLCVYRPHPSSEEVYVAASDLRSRTVKIFDMRSNRLIRSIGQGGYGSAPGQLNYPYFLCMCSPSGAGGALLVSNMCSNRIDLFDWESGRHVRSIGGGEGSGPGQLQRPGAIAVWTPQDDPTNAQVVVADKDNHRLQFFRVSDGRYVRSVGEAGTGPGQLRHPWAMSIHVPAGGRDEDALLVTIGDIDARIHVYCVVSGEYLRCLGGGEGGGVDQLSWSVYAMTFHRPSGEAETETQIIVSDYRIHRLQVFNLYSGAHMYSIGGGDSGLFHYPCCISMLCSDGDDDWDHILK